MATRSCSAVWISCSVRTLRYTKFEAMYSAETMATPRASESGRLRRGLRTSPAVKVTLFQASEENSAPTMATPTRRTVSKFHPAPRQKSVKLALTAAGLRPSRNPKPTRPSSAATLAKVKTFCTTAPVRMPRVLDQVRKTISAMASSCCVVSPIRPPPIR